MIGLIHKIPFFRVLVFYLAGIFIASFAGFPPHPYIFPLLLGLIAALFFLSFINKWQSFSPLFFFALLTISGFWVYQNHNTKPEFYSGTAYLATLLEYPVQKRNSYKVEARLTRVESNDSFFIAHEKLILYFEPDSLASGLKPGDQILFHTLPAEIRNPGNPYEFDYKKYLENRKIFRQVYLACGEWKNFGEIPGLRLKVVSEKIRQKLLNIYRENNITEERFAILSALTLGYKDALDPETKQVFSMTGATHVLSVSGLHVAIVFIAVKLIFGFLRRSRKGRFVFIAISFALLWMYALITGMSPPVLRATLMFCFVIIGENIKRPASIYNTLASSAFILLFFNPNLMFDIGFQLSYLAVFGIVFFQPGINSFFIFNNWLARWGWSLLSVSIAAQLATLPLTFYYFNQFPCYFWVSNFIVIPCSFIFIFLGIGILLFSFIPAVASCLSWITSYLVGACYFLLENFEHLPLAVVRNIQVSPIQYPMLLAAFFALIMFVSVKKKKYLWAFATILILVFMANIADKERVIREKQIIIYNSGDNQLIHLIAGFKNYVLYENELPEFSFEKTMVENLRTKKHLRETIYIRQDSTYEDDNLLMSKRMICFMGKSLLIDPPENMEKYGDLVLTNKSRIKSQNLHTRIISSGHYSKQEGSPPSFHLKKDGAYIINF